MVSKKMLACCLLLIAGHTMAQVNIIPQPVSVVMPKKAGEFTITPGTVIVTTASNKKTADFLNDYLKEIYGFSLKTSSGGNQNKSIVLKETGKQSTIAGAYDLDVNAAGITIAGNDTIGTFYGMQSLLQLLPVEKKSTLNVPFVTIHDEPRFAYRGLMLDAGRHFFPVPFVKKYIDFIALHKMNYFHWHLTDDQGWRIEIKKYPKLTQVGAYRNGTIIGHHPGTGNDFTKSGGFYTQEDVKEIVKYAADRYITVIPEIEMPGHASAAIAAYPQLSCFPNEPTKRAAKSVWSGDSTTKQVQQAWGVYDDVFCPSEYTFKFLQDVIDEVLPLFPAKYIHVGGDECPKTSWKRSDFCQNLMKEKGLKDEHALQSYFVSRMEKYINSKGKQIIGWDEILEGGLAPNATVMSWRGEEGGVEAAKQKHNVIMTPGSHCYFDHSQIKKEDSVTIGGYLPIAKVYSYEPIPKELSADDAKYVLGAQANLWTEYIDNPSKIEYMLLPRLSAISEALWSPKSTRDWSSFEARQSIQFKRYDLWKTNYSRAMSGE